MRNGTLSRKSRGFTLVELMVGVLIGLIGTVVIFQVFAVSEGQKRTTTGGSDAQQNGVFGLFQIERDIRMAGYGINHMALLGCQVNGWYEPTSLPVSFRMVPVEIINGAAGAPDQVRIAYGDSDLFTAPDDLVSGAGPAADFQLARRFGYRPGDLIVAGQEGRPCTLAQVSDAPANTTIVVRQSGNYVNVEGASVPTQHNRAGGLPGPNNTSYVTWVPATRTGGRMYNLGQRPAVVTYSIQNNQLVATNGLTPNAPNAVAPLADGVIQLQAQYGYDGNGDGRVASNAPSNAAVTIGTNNDQWSDSMPAAATGADWTRVIAIRLVVTARSMTPERPNPVSGQCETTVANPKWISPAPPAGIDVDISIADPANWRCYRYRTFEVVVPIRNMVWFAQET